MSRYCFSEILGVTMYFIYSLMEMYYFFFW